MEKLKAYYFTGTGNTRYVTENFAGIYKTDMIPKRSTLRKR